MTDITELRRLSKARHDGEASWDRLANALDEATGEIEYLQSRQKALMRCITETAWHMNSGRPNLALATLEDTIQLYGQPAIQKGTHND